MQMSDCSLPMFVGSLDAHEVMAWLCEAMLRYRITVLGMLLDIPVRFHRDLLSAITEVPGLAAEGRSETSDFESQGVAGADVHGGRKGRVNRGRQPIGRGFVDHQHDCEIEIHFAASIGDFEDFTVLARLSVGAFDSGTGGR